VFLSFAAASVLYSCGDRVEQVQQTIRADRVISEVAWDTTFLIGGDIRDTLLLVPRRFAARNHLLYVFDYGDSRLKAFHADGRFRWSFGREGEGPGEFKSVVDMEIDPEGAVWLLDVGVGRVTIVGSDGRLVDHIPLGDKLVRDILPLPNDTLATSFGPKDDFWVALSANGNVTASGPIPAPELGKAFYNFKAPFSFISSDNPTEWIAVFPFGDLWVVYDGRLPRCVGRLVEGGSFPTEPPQSPAPEDRPPVWVIGAAMDDSVAYILPKGKTDDAQRILDRYSARSCKYLGSIRLPRDIRSMVLSEGIFYVEYSDPVPTVLGIAQSSSPLPER
jgi:hypothetical protein